MKHIARLSIFIFSCITGQLYANDNNIGNIQTVLETAIPDLKIDSITPGPYAGIYQVTAGAEIFYVTEDGKYLLHGVVLDLSKDKQHWNLSQQAKHKIVQNMLAKLNLKDMIVFKPDKVVGSVYVFTDVDCGYCKKFQENISAIMAHGIEVRYLAFPRQDQNSATYKTAVSIWCSDTRLDTFTKAAKGEAVANKTCANPVASQVALGKAIGVMGTPTLVFADGTVLASYLSAEQLLEQIKKHSVPNTSKEP